ncbi:MAG TPA: GNAT family N-acetyltransferase [Tahibacter sp.]|jgi:GNAT superfamily N-acetyltransferase|nr:GNAT family N-acetyltransferase [Tahibacter sp.]
MDDIAVYRLDAAGAARQADALAMLLIDCVDGGASVGFLAPLPHERARDYWQSVVAGVGRGERVLLVAEDADGLLGSVQLVPALPDNQPHRADVAKLLVHRRARRRGVARALMAAVEAAARAAGRRVLVLDTVTGSAADHLYTHCGWQRVGEIPDYALMPDGRFCATTYFHKQLPP